MNWVAMSYWTIKIKRNAFRQPYKYELWAITIGYCCMKTRCLLCLCCDSCSFSWITHALQKSPLFPVCVPIYLSDYWIHFKARSSYICWGLFFLFFFCHYSLMLKLCSEYTLFLPSLKHWGIVHLANTNSSGSSPVACNFSPSLMHLHMHLKWVIS